MLTLIVYVLIFMTIAGIDTADYSQLGQSITLLPTGTIVKGGGFGKDQLIQVERIILAW